MTDQLSRTSHRVLEQMQHRRDRITGGGVRVWRAYRKPVDDAERISVQPVIVSCKPTTSAGWPTVLTDGGHPDGQLWVTDRRAVLAHGSEVRREWLWSDLDSVRVVPGYAGVVFFPSDSDTVCVIEKVNRDPAMAPRLTPVRRWLTIEATFANARGRLDEWYAELPSRMAAS